jgi:transposase
MAVTREGIPIRVWTWPGNTSDLNVIREVKEDLRAWKLTRVVWVTDRGFNSAANRRYLQRAGGHYIVGEKLRSRSQEPTEVLRRSGGRFRKVADNLEVKEVVLDQGTMRDRFVICRNPEAARRDAAIRTLLVSQLETAIAGSDEKSPPQRQRLADRLSHSDLGRFLRVTSTGLLRVDAGKVAEHQRLEGKFLLRTSDPTLSAEDVALGYKQLIQVERAWRDLKTSLDLRPVFHRKEERIRAHVLLCWLSLLLIRIAENRSGQTWNRIRWEMQKLHAVRASGPAGVVHQRTELTAGQRSLLRALDLAEPPRLLHLDPTDDSADTA